MALLLLALGLSAGGAAAVLCPSANHAASKSNDDDDAADGPGRAAVAVGVVLVLLVVALLAGLLFFTPRGRVLLERARGRRAEATPPSYFEMEGGPEPAGGLTVTENKMLA